MSEARIYQQILQVVVIVCLAGQALLASVPRLPLEKAAFSGDLDLTEKLLAEGQSQYARNSALEHAIGAGHRDVMELLIAHGAKQALVMAAVKGDIELVKYLLSREQDPGAQDSAFHAAVRMQHRDIAGLLLTRGADVDTRRWNELTPLFFAVTGIQDDDISRWQTEIRYRRKSKSRRPPGTLDLVQFLINHGADVNAKGGSPALTPIYYAIHGGNLKIVETLIAHGADVTVEVHYSHVDSRFTTPLHLAADYGDLAMCKLLVEHGADVNAQMPAVTGGSNRNSRQSPLHHAASSGNVELVTFLLDQGADINTVSGWGRTPLDTAVRLREQAAAEVLLARGAEVNTSTERGETPLHSAAINKNRDLVELLLAHGAKPDPKNRDGRTPTSIAVENGSDEIVALLMSRLGRTTLHSAASTGDIEAMAALVDRGVKIDRIDIEGRTALHAAVRAGQVSAVKWLLAQGANPASPDDEDVTPLTIAFRIAQYHSFSRDPNEVARVEALKRKQREILVLLIGHGAAPSFAWGMSPAEVRAQPAQVTEVLLKAGTDFEVQRDRQATVLHRAAWWGRTETVAALLALGADVHATDGMGATPLHAANQRGSTAYWDVIGGPHVDVLELLLQHGAHVNAANKFNATPLHGAADSHDVNAVDLLIRHGADVHATDDEGRTPLHMAARNGSVAIMAHLLAQGADLNAADKEGNTPLLLLLSGWRRKDEARTKMNDYALDLIRRGARVDVQNSQGMALLHYAGSRGYVDLTEELLRQGAPVNAQTAQGWTALHGAVDEVQEDCVKVLIAHGAQVNGLGHKPEMSSRATFSKLAQTPLLIAVSSGSRSIAQLLIEAGADVNAAGGDGRTPLALAYKRNRRSIFQLLTEHGADPNVRTSNGTPLIYAAAVKQDRDIVDALLRHGARADADLINALLETGTTPLHLAAREGDLSRVNELLANGAEPNMPGKGGWPIHQAYAERHIDIVKRLLPRTPASVVTNLLIEEIESHDCELVPLFLAHGADVNADDFRRSGTLLHTLVWRAASETIELFLQHGANVNNAGGTSETALTRAVMGKRKDIVALLLAHGADCNLAPTAQYTYRKGRTPLSVALSQGFFEIATMLVEAGADVNARSESEQVTPLHMAISNHALFELMLARGAHIDSRSYRGQTPLHIAADLGRTDTVEYLVAKGASTDAQDNQGNTPLHLAAKKGHRAVCQTLLRSRADITIRNKWGRLPQEYAMAAELDDLVTELTPKVPER